MVGRNNGFQGLHGSRWKKDNYADIGIGSSDSLDSLMRTR